MLSTCWGCPGGAEAEEETPSSVCGGSANTRKGSAPRGQRSGHRGAPVTCPCEGHGWHTTPGTASSGPAAASHPAFLSQAAYLANG